MCPILGGILNWESAVPLTWPFCTQIFINKTGFLSMPFLKEKLSSHFSFVSIFKKLT
jgi:hypothetical protein